VIFKGIFYFKKAKTLRLSLKVLAFLLLFYFW